MELDLNAAINAIQELRDKVELADTNSDAETEWLDEIGEKLVEAQDCLREAALILEDGPEDEGDENDNPA